MFRSYTIYFCLALCWACTAKLEKGFVPGSQSSVSSETSSPESQDATLERLETDEVEDPATLTFTSKDLGTDLVMVIDNSGSMTRVQKAVQAEIGPLIKKIKAFSDIHLTIITATHPQAPACAEVNQNDRGAHFTLPPALDFTHINCAIDSFSDLRSLINLFEQKTLAGTSFDQVFRKSAVKVFLSISDDGTPLNYKDWFIDSAEKLWNKDMIFFYHFSGGKAPSIGNAQQQQMTGGEPLTIVFPSEIALAKAAGYPYAQDTGVACLGGCGNCHSPTLNLLSSHYRGKRYPICTKNWAESFTSLSDHAKNLVQRTYVLSAWKEIKDLAILKVTVAGQVLPENQYSLSTDGSSIPVLKLHDNVTVNSGDSISVHRK